jgi:hypothetical protein
MHMWPHHHHLQFMVGQKLGHGMGVSWGLAEGAREVHVPDLGARDGVNFFRGEGANAQARGAAYFGVPLVGINGEVMGMLAVDNMGSAGEWTRVLALTYAGLCYGAVNTRVCV